MEELMSKRGWNIAGYIYSYIYILDKGDENEGK